MLLRGLLLTGLLMKLGSQLFRASRAQSLFNELTGLTAFAASKALGLDLSLARR